jgi:hypothetical protein
VQHELASHQRQADAFEDLVVDAQADVVHDVEVVVTAFARQLGLVYRLVVLTHQLISLYFVFP